MAIVERCKDRYIAAMEALFGHPSFREFTLQDAKRLPARFFGRIHIVTKSPIG